MKVFGKWLIYCQDSKGNKSVISWDMIKNKCVEFLDFNAVRVEGRNNLWTNGDGNFFWIEKNTKEYR